MIMTMTMTMTGSEKLVLFGLDGCNDGTVIFSKHIYFHNQIHNSISCGVLKKDILYVEYGKDLV